MSRQTDLNQKLHAGYQPKQRLTVRGKKTHYTISANKREADPNEEYSVVFPKLSKKEVIYMDTAKLMFNFENSNNKSWFVNNLGKQLQKNVKVLYDKAIIYESENEIVIETYSDLWKSDKEREQMLEFGVADEGVCKIWSGDDSAPGSRDAVVLTNNNDVLALPLTKVFEGSGPISTYTMKDLEYVLKLPTSEELMVAQTGEAKGKYKLTNINLKFETVKGDEVSRETSNLYRRGTLSSAEPWYYGIFCKLHNSLKIPRHDGKTEMA